MMNLLDVLEDISEGTPTPGGGAVGWLVWGQATALLRMVSNLTLKSKKWVDGHPASSKIISITHDFQEEAVQGFSLDCKAYDEVVAAYARSTDDGKSNAVEKASLWAAEVPLELMNRTKDVLLLMSNRHGNHNRNAHSDMISAAMLLKSSAVIASKNVEANIPYLAKSDEERVSNTLGKLRGELSDLMELVNEGAVL